MDSEFLGLSGAGPASFNPRRPMDDITLKQLIVEAQSGDRAALNQLLEYCRHLLLARAHVLHLPFPDAQDLVQQTLIVVVRKLPEFQWRNKEAFHRWLVKLLFGKFSDRRKKRRVTPIAPTDPGQVPDNGPPPPDEAIKRETVERVQQAVARLPQVEQDILHLHYMEGVPLKDVGDLLKPKRARGTVRNRHSKALKTLRRQMGM